MSSKSVLQGCQIGVSRKSVLQECQVRVSYKSVKQECLTRALRDSVKQGCPTRVPPQCVKSGCLTSEVVGHVTNKYCLCLSTYVSAFGFVGFILFCVFFVLQLEPNWAIAIGNGVSSLRKHKIKAYLSSVLKDGVGTFYSISTGQSNACCECWKPAEPFKPGADLSSYNGNGKLTVSEVDLS